MCFLPAQQRESSWDLNTHFLMNRDLRDQDDARIREVTGSESSALWRSRQHFKPPISSQRCFNQFGANEAWTVRLGLTSVIEEAQVRQDKPPLLPQFHSCAVLKTRQEKTVKRWFYAWNDLDEYVLHLCLLHVARKRVFLKGEFFNRRIVNSSLHTVLQDIKML